MPPPGTPPLSPEPKMARGANEPFPLTKRCLRSSESAPSFGTRSDLGALARREHAGSSENALRRARRQAWRPPPPAAAAAAAPPHE